MRIETDRISGFELHQNLPVYLASANGNFFRLPSLIILGSFLISALSVSSIFAAWRISQSESNIVKFLPMLLIIVAAVMVIPILPVDRVLPLALNTLKINIFLTFYTLFALIGSSYARFVLHQETSYFTQAVTSVAFYAAYFVFSAVPDQSWSVVVKWVLRAFWFVAFFATFTVGRNLLTFLIAGAEFQRANHELAFLLASTIALPMYFATKSKKIFSLAFMTIVTILTLKNTAILLVLASILLLFLMPSSKKQNPIILKLITVTPMILAVGLVYLQLKPYTSDGNTYFREFLLQYGINQFWQSPIYGHLFTGETATRFATSIHGTLQLDVPVHNDWLDVLIQGGAIGLLIFFGIFIFLLVKLWLARQEALVNFNDIRLIVTTWLIILLVNHMITMAINPVLPSSDIATIIWILVAFAHRTINVSEVQSSDY